MTFSWDPGKAATNFRKHGVDFREAATALAGPLSTTFPDDTHSITERRFVTIGVSAREQVLVVVHTETTKAIRIISARLATRREREFYEED